MEEDQTSPTFSELFPRLSVIAKAVGKFCAVHELASHGDHFIAERTDADQAA